MKSEVKLNLELGVNLQVLAKHKGLQWDTVLRLEEVHSKLGISLEEMLLVTEDALHAEPYSREEVCKCLGISLEELRTQILTPNTQDGESTGQSIVWPVCHTQMKVSKRPHGHY